jgi:two-component system sensor histidine kinase/response regulator
MGCPPEVPFRERSRLVRYGIALGVTGLSLFLRWPLWPVLGSQTPHMTFFPAVMIAAYLGGFGPGVVATVLSAVAAQYFIYSYGAYGAARYSLQFGSIHDVVALSLYVVVGVVVSGLCESLHRNRRRFVADERRRAEEAIRSSEERFRCMFDNVAVGIAHADLEGRWFRVNQKFCDILGYSAEELLGKSSRDVCMTSESPDGAQNHQRLIRGECPSLAAEKQFRRKDGSLGWIHATISLFRDPCGAPAYTMAIVQDITEKKKAVQALRLANSLLDTGVRSSNVGIFEIELNDGRYVGGTGHFVNVWEQLGDSPPEVRLDSATESAAWMNSLHPDERARVLSEIESQITGRGTDYHAAYRARHRDGSERWMLSRGTITRDDSGKAVRVTGSRIDITDLKQIENELRHAKEQAEAANRAKDEFLANVSHEIRTPMNAILGMTDLALDSSLTNDQRQILKTVKSAADNLLGLINDLLDFSKIEAGKLELDVSDFSLRSALGDTLRALKVRAKSKGLELSLDVRPDVPDLLLGDSGRLRQVLLNLVGNAVKFTESGSVRVGVAVAEPAPNGNLALRFQVTDTGIGIPQDKQQAIFRAFEQEDTSTTRKYGGTGLGLTIAARLVELMGGVISVESQLGQGSTFAFTARFGLQPDRAWEIDGASEKRTDSEPHTPAPEGARPLRVLVAEDNDFNAQLIEQVLARRGHHVSIAQNGREALALLESGDFELLILDIHMPELDGFEVTRALRRRERETGAHLPIIALTARSRKEDREKCLEVGMDDFLTKPFRASDLWAVMERVAGSSREAAVVSEDIAPQSPALDAATILAACGEHQSLLAKMCHSFRVKIPNHLASLKDALSQQDAPRIREAAHKICGMIATFSSEAGDIAERLERSAAAGDLADCGPLAQRLTAVTSELVVSIDGLTVETLRGSIEADEPAVANRLVGQTIGPLA